MKANFFSLTEMIHFLGFKKERKRIESLDHMQKQFDANPASQFDGMDAIPIEHNGMRRV